MTILPMEEALQMLLNVLVSIGMGYAQSPLTTLLVNISKVIPFLGNLSGQLLQTLWAVILTVLTWIAYSYFTHPQVDSIVQFLGVIAAAIMQLFFNTQVSARIHASAYTRGNQLFGYTRSVPKPEI